MVYIETKRLVLRNFITADSHDLHEILGDAETMKYCEPAYDLVKTKDFLLHFCIGSNGAIAAAHKQSQKVIGYILFHEIDPGSYELGWIFHRSYWQQGYAFEACSAVIDYAFCALAARKVFAETIDGVRSVKLMEKLGMKLESIEREQAKDIDGNWADLYFYGLLREDWEERR